MKKIENLIFKLYSNCIITKGSRSIILCDLQDSRIINLPFELIDILYNTKYETFNEITNEFSLKIKKELSKYLIFLCNENYAMFHESKTHAKKFIPIDFKFNLTDKISNIIIEIKEFSNINNIVKAIISNNIKYVEIRFYAVLKLNEIISIIDKFKLSDVANINIYCMYNSDFRIETIRSLLNIHLRIYDFFIFNSPINKIVKMHHNQTYVSFKKSKMINELNCGAINKKLFNLNMESYTESLKHNSCLNKKISIDAEGNIKNCPSMKESFGNIKDTTLEEAIAKKGFKKLWNVSKDKIKVCQDCEFRYICTDCRAYIEDPKDMYSKPLKCGYDPYTGIWEEWSTNPLKQKAIKYYGKEALVKKDG